MSHCDTGISFVLVADRSSKQAVQPIDANLPISDTV